MKTKEIFKLMQQVNFKANQAFLDGDFDRWEHYQHIIGLLEEELNTNGNTTDF